MENRGYKLSDNLIRGGGGNCLHKFLPRDPKDPKGE